MTIAARLWHCNIESAYQEYEPVRADTVYQGMAVSLNHKRRIFRPATGPRPFRDRRMPLLGLLLITVGCAAILVAASWFLQSSKALVETPASSQISAPAGRLAVLDGDTLRVGDQVVQLEGIAAPARGSVCHRAAQADLDCGSAAANALASLVRGGSVDCTIHGRDQRGRPVGNCVAAGVRLNEAMVRNGWARAEVDDLRELEASARAAGRGIWDAR